MRHRLCALCVLLVFALAACADPPSKEMNQAQGAIDAAKAAGAEAFAPTELAAAVDALKRSEDAAAQRDYRLALGLAIDSRENAQLAAKTATTARARARGEVEATVGEATTLLNQARERLRSPEAARLPRRALQEPRTAIDGATKSLQEARAALNAEDYPRAQKAVNGISARIRKAMAQIDEATDSGASRRRR